MFQAVNRSEVYQMPMNADRHVSDFFGAETMLYQNLEKLNLLPCRARDYNRGVKKKVNLTFSVAKVISSTLRQKNVSSL